MLFFDFRSAHASNEWFPFYVIVQRDNGNNLRTIFEQFSAGLCNLQLKPIFSYMFLQ